MNMKVICDDLEAEHQALALAQLSRSRTPPLRSRAPSAARRTRYPGRAEAEAFLRSLDAPL